MSNPTICCEDEEEFENRIRLSKDARAKISGKQKEDTAEKTVDRIADAEANGRRKFYVTDYSFFEYARLDPKTVLYLEQRAKTCYPLRPPNTSLPALIACFKDEDRSPLECECQIRDYLHSVNLEKHGLAEHLARSPRPPKKQGDKKKTEKKK